MKLSYMKPGEKGLVSGKGWADFEKFAKEVFRQTRTRKHIDYDLWLEVIIPAIAEWAKGVAKRYDVRVTRWMIVQKEELEYTSIFFDFFGGSDKGFLGRCPTDIRFRRK